uniref:F-box domain-containing protein n=1 Tax=Aegilops tauschii TaxID=37682 RepID=M8BS47_AEGTA
MERALASGKDRISALPDELLQHVMSFLLSRNAVRTCVLARRWSTLWKSVPALRIEDDLVTDSNKFVDELLRLRDPVPLNIYQFYAGDGAREAHIRGQGWRRGLRSVCGDGRWPAGRMPPA